ncbi:DNA translocase FtsK [Desertibacillus haloalkaliphilus]|nr:DNA translocase FtsK [Desertibacillus haloalkaliphilus]
MFFGNEYDEEEVREISKPKQQERKLGRIENDERASEPRVIHQYPKQGNFRFPMIDDDQNVREKQTERKGGTPPPQEFYEENEEQERVEPTKPTEPSKQIFANENFKPSSIPSPVHGFGAREKNESLGPNDHIGVQQTENEKIIPFLNSIRQRSRFVEEPDPIDKPLKNDPFVAVSKQDGNAPIHEGDESKQTQAHVHKREEKQPDTVEDQQMVHNDDESVEDVVHEAPSKQMKAESAATVEMNEEDPFIAPFAHESSEVNKQDEEQEANVEAFSTETADFEQESGQASAEIDELHLDVDRDEGENERIPAFSDDQNLLTEEYNLEATFETQWQAENEQASIGSEAELEEDEGVEQKHGEVVQEQESIERVEEIESSAKVEESEEERQSNNHLEPFERKSEVADTSLPSDKDQQIVAESKPQGKTEPEPTSTQAPVERNQREAIDRVQLEPSMTSEGQYQGEGDTARVTQHKTDSSQPASAVLTERKETEEKPRSQKTLVPFNVMMLSKDKAKQNQAKETNQGSYQFPSIQLLSIPPRQEEENTQWLEEQSQLLEETLANFNVKASVNHVTKGPSVTRFEVQPAPGVKVSKITNLTDDIKLSLAAKDIRMEAPIPGKNAIGIEIPNQVSTPVVLREIIRQEAFRKSKSPLMVALGLDISGEPIVTDLQKMPHGLIAGATGSGKSVCINSILISLMYKATPDEVKLLLIDPKMVELAPYRDMPHLVTPVITDSKQATMALKWVVEEMERRYELFSQRGVRDIGRYNELFTEETDEGPAMPYIVVVIDELADLMMVSPQDVEDAICRIAQKARACGIHLLLATQRPSVDVITGLIKANVPTRVAFSVSSQTDSRTIIDMSGAERLLGKGDMLFHENGSPKPVRVQGTFVSDDEIDRVMEFVKDQREPSYMFDNDHLVKAQKSIEQEDDLFEDACYYVIEQGGASSSSVQRRFRVGFNRAARLIDMMEAKGIVSEAMGSKPRQVLMTVDEFEERVLHHTD